MTRRGVLQMPLMVAVLGAALPLSGSSYLLGIGFSLCCWIALVQSWTVLSAMAGYVSLGHVVFYGLGAYVVALCWGVLPLPVVLILAGAVAGVFALLVGLPLLALDRIIANRQGLISSFQAHDTPLARQASDHLPVKAVIDLQHAVTAA